MPVSWTPLATQSARLPTQASDELEVAEGGCNYSLLCVRFEIPEETLQISGIRFRSVGNSAFRAWPLFLFTQAA